MKCPQCVEEGKKSTVYPGYGTRTLIGNYPYYDEDGNYHDHDPNCSTYRYECSNKHIWSEISKQLTCWCGWPEKKELT